MRLVRLRPVDGPARLLRGGRVVHVASCLTPLLLASVLAACGTTGRFIDILAGEDAPPPDSARAFTVVLFGDGGDVPVDQEAPLRLLGERLARLGPNSAVVFLGDNIYPSGLPPASSPARRDAEQRIDNQLAVVDSFPGHVVFVPGNHDWGGLGLGGDREAVRRQERYVERVLGRGNTFLPDNGFPGPAVVELTDSLTLVVVDTQWWLEENKPYGDTGQYYLEQETEFLLELDDVLRRYADTHVIVAAHHPIFTNGSHGGFFPGSRGLNPVNVLGRGYLGTPQDLSNYKYRRLRDALLAIFGEHDGLVYAAGHEHSLQYFAHDEQHYIVSGAGSKESYVAEGHGASFVDEGKGHGELDYYTDGSIWLTFYKAGDAAGADRPLYRTRLREGTRPLVAFRGTTPAEAVVRAHEVVTRNVATDGEGTVEPDDDPDPEDADTTLTAADTEPLRPEVIDSTTARLPDPPTTQPLPAALRAMREDDEPYAFVSQGTVTVRPAPQFDVGPVRRLLFGEHYRDLWDATVEVPVLDLARTAGGLTPLQRGGGLQTLTLRLQGGDGDEYVLRSVSKDPTRSLPAYLRETVAHDLLEDQLSAIHPYGAFTVPKLAEAAGIFHTHPTLVYIPYDDRLGIYKETFGGVLALFESRPDGDQRDEDRFGNPENVVGTPKLFEDLAEDNDRRVDERAYARARLFDMLIGDWDRHGDQWRWAEYEPFEVDPSLTGDERTRGRVYLPIPRDRDFAYFRFDGLVSILARNSGVPAFRRYTNFFSGIGDLYGLNFNGAPLDRRLTSTLTKDDWLSEAYDLQARLTDTVLGAALRDMPAPAYDEMGEAMLEELRARRARLPDVAARYYDLLAHIVDVVGSDQHERFEVTRLTADSTRVVVYKTDREGAIQYELYRRAFGHVETSELRLYGLDGRDAFVVRGEAAAGPLLRAIGGPGDDTFVDSSRVDGSSRRNLFYDTPDGNTWATSGETRVLQSDDPAHNAYALTRFEKDVVGPLFSFGRDIDEGFEIGAGVSYIDQAFRKLPYASRHQAGLAYGTRSGAVNAFYQGDVVGFRGPWDARLNADFYSKGYFRNFYGLGNETDLEDRARYQAVLRQAVATPALRRQLHPFADVSLGPRFEYTHVGRDDAALPTELPPDAFGGYAFAGFGATFNVDGTDTLAATRAGVRWRNEARALAGVAGTRRVHARLASELSYFYTYFVPLRVTVGVRVGGAMNVGKFAFFHANTLGGQDNLRGFRRTRFAGRHSFFQNVDVRVRLFEFNAYLARGEFGAVAFFDNGRVWADGEDSGRWHQGYGGGLWVSPFYRIVVTASVARSSENTLFDLSAGFFF